ncbi:MAG TPA: ABC transporter permease [Burkholderiales bacterium]|nr:ABC transporter permease [Burkholderiales bacterium]
MLALYRELEGTTYLLLYAIRRLGVLRLPPVMEELVRQIYFTGAAATGGIVLRGAFIGTLIIAYVIEVLHADAELAVKLLLWVVLREVGPLIAAVLVIQRSGTAIATELALRTITGEIDSLRRMRIDPRDYLVVPRVVATAVSNAALTLYVQMIAVGGGMVLSSIMINVPLGQMLGTFFELASPLDMMYSLIKSLLFGAAIAGIACYHGLNPGGRSINAVPPATIRAVTEALLSVMLLNVVFAYLVYGVALWGLVTVEQ